MLQLKEFRGTTKRDYIMADEIKKEPVAEKKTKKRTNTKATKPVKSEPQEKIDAKNRASESDDNQDKEQKPKITVEVFEDTNNLLKDLLSTYEKLLARVRLKDERIKKLGSDNGKLKKELQEENETSSELRKKNQELTGDLAKRESSISNLQNKIREYEQKKVSLESEIDHLNKEIVGREALVNISNQNGSSQVEELKNKLAYSLSINFQDYIDCKDEPMSIELGENLRFQIENIFKLLKELGISVG